MSEAADPVPEPKTRVHRTRSQTWTQVFIGFGLGLTIIWMVILARGIVKIIEIAI
jgi:hypothetical protein